MQVSKALHLVWTDVGMRSIGRKVEDVRTDLKVDTLARGVNESDGSGIYVAHPRILEHYFIDFPGTSFERGYAPCLNLFEGRAKVDCNWVGSADPQFGSALCDSLPRNVAKAPFIQRGRASLFVGLGSSVSSFDFKLGQGFLV